MRETFKSRKENLDAATIHVFEKSPNLLLQLHRLVPLLSLTNNPFLPLFILFCLPSLSHSCASRSLQCRNISRTCKVCGDPKRGITQFQKEVRLHEQTCHFFSVSSTYLCRNCSAQLQKPLIHNGHLEQQQKKGKTKNPTPKQLRMAVVVQHKYLIEHIYWFWCSESN